MNRPQITRRPDRGLLLYDSDCGFCTDCARWLIRRGAGVAVRPLAAADVVAVGVDAARARREIPLLAPDGTTLWGASAIAGALTSCPPPWRWAGRIIAARAVRPLAAAVYRWVAKNRRRFPGSSDACSL